jgi:hypothetical protein
MYYKYVSFTFPLPKRISIFRQRDFPLSHDNYKKGEFNFVFSYNIVLLRSPYGKQIELRPQLFSRADR